jgi:hypothetical protein
VDRQIHVEPSVAMIVGPQLETIVSQRRHGPMVCDICGASIELDEPASMLAYSDVSMDRTLIRFAHERCAPSMVINTDFRDDPPEQIGIRWRAYVRPRHENAGVLLWEPIATLDYLKGGSPIAARLRELGFQPTSDAVDEVEPIAIDNAVLDFTQGDTLRLISGGTSLMSFGEVAQRDPELMWRASVRQSGSCILIYADALGLARPSKEQLDRRLQSAPYPLAAKLRVAGVRP